MSSENPSYLPVFGTAKAVVYGIPYHLGLKASDRELGIGRVEHLWIVDTSGGVSLGRARANLRVSASPTGPKLLGAQPWMREHGLERGDEMAFAWRTSIAHREAEICVFPRRRTTELSDRQIEVLLKFIMGYDMMDIALSDDDDDDGTALRRAEVAGTGSRVDAVLEGLVGLAPLRAYLMRCASLGRALRAHRDLTGGGPTFTLHAAFVGSPGTGKTESARRVARLFFELGLIQRAEPVIVGGRELVGKHVGTTDPLVRETVAKALGGVLFIDEAYTLAWSESRRDFGHEAIATLIELMEKHRHELVVIFAGYPREIARLLDANPGLRSRVPASNVVPFPRLDANEAYEAFRLMATQAKVEVDPGCRHVWHDLDLLFEMPTTGREVRNLFEALLADVAADRAFISGRPLRIEPADFAVVPLRRRRAADGLSRGALALPPDDEPN